jgi:thiamine biosynthesis lipoprotein
VRLDLEDRTIMRDADGVQVDLGGIAKGYALDLAGEAMLSAGAHGALVDVGGDVRAIGTNAAGKPWRVGIKHPFHQTLHTILELSDRAVATSGVQQRFYEIDGKRYSHIIDPRSGRPAEQAPSVTVIAADGITADAWATVFSVLTVEEGRQLIAAGAAPKLEVMWIAGPANQPIVDRTPGFDVYVAE